MLPAMNLCYQNQIQVAILSIIIGIACMVHKKSTHLSLNMMDSIVFNHSLKKHVPKIGNMTVKTGKNVLLWNVVSCTDEPSGSRIKTMLSYKNSNENKKKNDDLQR